MISKRGYFKDIKRPRELKKTSLKTAQDINLEKRYFLFSITLAMVAWKINSMLFLMKMISKKSSGLLKRN